MSSPFFAKTVQIQRYLSFAIAMTNMAQMEDNPPLDPRHPADHDASVSCHLFEGLTVPLPAPFISRMMASVHTFGFRPNVKHVV
ncbi:hypothetical protein JMJ77_0010096 [Colletotrichum scovillei]|uniref:Uncharacterized protein n=1 Tax=Colletotrichum scovillei TaxID=1209932 RepID=A0A9P7QSC8_9PEZI|nr:hypothetical protein JMJ78_0011475 [Colletotrichum scovillei]KAG7041989.1 hypothetical protein JMJ77_0010096 [Colletotrichum scovillei]KAG7062020.1 hypothetical protein JMJ76_0006303 [Colletotrichum scovillei]